jgi:hypothetical protein
MQLRRNLAALLEALNEERQQRVASDKRLAAARDDALELQTQYEVRLDTAKIEEKRLRAQLRTLMGSAATGGDDLEGGADGHEGGPQVAALRDVALVYEEQTNRLCRELEELRRRNLLLEERELRRMEEASLMTSGRGVFAAGRGRNSQGEQVVMRRSANAVLGMSSAFTSDDDGIGLWGDAAAGAAGVGAGGNLLRASHPLPSPNKSNSGVGVGMGLSSSGAVDPTAAAAFNAAEQALFQASLRGAHASSKLRRLAAENVSLKSTVEELRRRERLAAVQERLHEQGTKKLKAAHGECARLQTR